MISEEDKVFCLNKAKEIADYCKDEKSKEVDTTKLKLIWALINHCLEYASLGSIIKEFVKQERQNEKGE